MSVNNDGILLAGDVLFSRLINNAYTGYVDLNAGKLEMKHNSETKDIISKGRHTYGQLLGSVTIPKPTDFSLMFGKVSPKALAMGLQGEASVYAQSSGTVTDEAVTAIKGSYVDLAFRNISATGFVVTDSAGTITYVLNTDYTVDYVSGQLLVLVDSVITDAQALKVDYSYNAVSADKVVGGIKPNVRGMLRLKGQNLFDGLPADITIWDVTLSSDSGVDWLSDKPVEITMKGRMTTPAGKAGPYELVYNQVLA